MITAASTDNKLSVIPLNQTLTQRILKITAHLNVNAEFDREMLEKGFSDMQHDVIAQLVCTYTKSLKFACTEAAHSVPTQFGGNFIAAGDDEAMQHDPFLHSKFHWLSAQ